MRASIFKDLLSFRVRPALLMSLAVSVSVHAAALVWLGFTRSGQISAEALTSSADTLLTFSDPPQEKEQTDPPPPEPVPEMPPPAPPPELTETPPVAATLPQPEPPRPAPPPPTRPVAPPPAPKVAPRESVVRNTVFAGVQARRAQRIVYVVDASGPMASSLAFVKSELARSIGALAADQSFQVLFFRESAGSDARSGSAFEAFGATSGSPQLTLATADAKKQFASWLATIRPTGRSNPQPALEEAIRLGPDLVFVLSRRIKRTNLSDAAGEVRQVVAALDRLNPQDSLTGKRAVVIKTIQFLDDDPSGLLQSIAQAHGDGAGSYRLLTLDQLPKR